MQRAPLLRFRVPFSTPRPRRALFPKAAGLRTCPAPAFGLRLPPALTRGPRSAMLRPCGFPLCGKMSAASLDPRTFGSGSFDRRERVARPRSTHAFACRLPSRRSRLHRSTGRDLHRLWSVARVRSVKPTRLIRDPHARGGPVGPSALSPHLPYRPGRVIRRRVLSRGVPLPAVPGLARPCRYEWSFPLRHARV